MKKFNIKAYLAAGLSHRLEKMDAQTVVEVIPGDPEIAIRSNLRVVKNIEEANGEFMAATKIIMDKKLALFNELSEQYGKETKGLSDEEKGKRARELNEEFARKAAEVQKTSTAKPDEIVSVLLSDDDYTKVLLPVFKKTAGAWDERGDGSGQRTFIEVADALNTAEST